MHTVDEIIVLLWEQLATRMFFKKALAFSIFIWVAEVWLILLLG